MNPHKDFQLKNEYNPLFVLIVINQSSKEYFTSFYFEILKYFYRLEQNFIKETSIESLLLLLIHCQKLAIVFSLYLHDIY
jgi:hypothetical protein